MSTSDIRDGNAELLAKLMDLGRGEEPLWRPEELGAILRHQLTAPIEFDLGSFDEPLAEQLKMLTSGHGLLLQSVADLLHHSHPPVELLRTYKHFARACWDHPDSPLPREISMVLYFASIAVAQTKCGQWITSLDAATLRRHFQWFCQQPWVDEDTRSLFREGLCRLDSEDDAHA